MYIPFPLHCALSFWFCRPDRDDQTNPGATEKNLVLLTCFESVYIFKLMEASAAFIVLSSTAVRIGAVNDALDQSASETHCFNSVASPAKRIQGGTRVSINGVLLRLPTNA